MLFKKKRIMFIATLTVLGSTGLTSTANAEYGYYQNNPQQQVRYQQASYQASPHLNNHADNPPEILPYVAFDNTPTGGANIFQPTSQPMNLSYRPQVNNYQPISRQMPAGKHLSAERQHIIAAAKQQMGIKYRWGGNTPREGFDCSGFTKFALKGLGANIPRTAAQQSKASRHINRSDLRPGDLVFFKTSGKRVNHVGIYLGNGRFIHAASGGGRVMTDDLRKGYWQKRIYKYGTFLG